MTTASWSRTDRAELDVISELPAVVAEVHVAAGSHVRRGDELALLESMKMEIPVQASTDGVVQVVVASPGDSVAEGDVLLQILRTGVEA